MNTAYRFCICTVSVVAFGLLTGCQGLQGIRYHEEFGKLSGEDGMIAHDAGFEVGMGDALGDGSSPAPHPRFHPRRRAGGSPASHNRTDRLVGVDRRAGFARQIGKRQRDIAITDAAGQR